MPFAVSLRSRDRTADAIMSLWDQASAFEDSPSMRALGYPPHITFAIYDSPDASEQAAIDALQKVAKRRPAIELSLDRIRIFEGSPLILWADPKPKTPLREIHARIHAAIDPRLCRPHYRPESWMPHCTLATRIVPDRNPDALAFAGAFHGRLRVVFDVMDCVRLAPLQVMAEAPLAHADARIVAKEERHARE
jgi:2'-5' RNA ligase